jgi:hypothetical protein
MSVAVMLLAVNFYLVLFVIVDLWADVYRGVPVTRSVRKISKTREPLVVVQGIAIFLFVLMKLVLPPHHVS